ncbi:hypothetical protein E3N88_21932 [Mikania micrantha]|uniref:Integrase catalytic domain-containing protein n=1 Tax=Mikania micrantha TaxID=192012 RepID=A0A5N6N907_9ASTR|nr:hypothetical protein E3N88_21932 [Mikania micrantha]
MTTTNNAIVPANNSFALRSILDREKLNGTNFMDWYRNLRIVLTQDKKMYVLEGPIPEAPAPNATKAVRDAWAKHFDDAQTVACLMLATMEPNLQHDLEYLKAYEIIEELKLMFEVQARQEIYDTMISLVNCRMQEGTPVGLHVMKMKGYVERLERLGSPLKNDLAIIMILGSLPKSYNQFVMNYNMNGFEKSISELLGMLRIAEKNITNKPQSVLMIREGQVKKPNKQGKGKGKKPWVTPSGKGKAVAKFKKQEQKPAAKAPTKAPKNPNCFHCGEPNHWKRDCPKYLAEMKKNPVGAGTSGIFVIELYAFNSNSWVFDTGCGTHICNDLQGLKKARELREGQLVLHVGNGARVAVEAVGEYSLLLPSGLYLKLNNVCYVPSLTRNIISAARLYEQGFTFGFHEGNILTFKSNVMYFEARPHNGIYEVDIHGSCSDNSIYALNTKRLKTNFNQTYLWHCRLGHINKKRMSKLQTDGILKPTGSESFDICESCLCGKMTKAPFTGIGGRASDLLGLIHTDVCGPFRIMSRSAFEVFKVFQNEVQNQLGKTIKAIRSDRGGEYLSYDFNEHLKKCGIISQLTPPGTPQHNGVSERRNRTLLDMVRSMMSRANLPHSFWSYALETAARIVNMVPTKKVDKTPYELWYGRKPNLSYLRVWGCEAYVKRETSNKLDPRGEKVIFVGYPKETKAYYFYHSTDKKVFIARRAIFLEEDFLSKGMDGNNVDLDEVQDSLNAGPEVETIDQQMIVEPEPLLVQAPITWKMVSKRWCNKGVQQDDKIWILKLVGVLVQDYANFFLDLMAIHKRRVGMNGIKRANININVNESQKSKGCKEAIGL